VSHARNVAAALGAIGLAVACDGPSEPVRYATPVAIRASLVLEPPSLQVGEVASLDVTVVTPPEHTLRPFAAPDEIDGFWLLETEPTTITREPQRWIHRTRLRIRARSVGTFEWPASEVHVDVPDGELHVQSLEPLPIEIVSVFPDYPGRLAPFGLEPLRHARSSTPQRLGWAAAGALGTLATLGLVWLARRRPREAQTPRPDDPSLALPWETVGTRLVGAGASMADDPRHGCGMLASALRHYMNERYGADALARTTEELEPMPPPFAATSKWPEFVAILVEIDALRLAPLGQGEAGDMRRRADDLLERARRFVNSTLPRESA
jgi:hypothetical protein